MPLQATSGAASYDAFGGGVPVEPNYIESCFSTWLYTGTSASQTITNGIDLSGKGGLVVIKGRDSPTGSSAYGGTANQFTWQDTVRGITQTLCSNRTDAQLQAGGFASNGSISSTGFTLDYNGYNDYNRSPNTYASWTFRKQPKFFDVVTWTGDGSSSQAISHSLGSVPACVIFKKLNNNEDWTVWHRSLSTDQYLILNSTSAVQTLTGLGPAAGALTSTTITVPQYLNSGSQPFVAYLFAHDAGGFGLTGTDNVISCGSFTTDGSGNATVNLGYEPQWILWKESDAPGNWNMSDTMRGLTASSAAQQLRANTSGAEISTNNPSINATGFSLFGTATGTFIYIAIRRGPMKVPTSGTSVYNGITRTGTGSGSAQITGVGFAPDAVIGFGRTASVGTAWYDRLRGKELALRSALTNAEYNASPGGEGTFSMDGVQVEYLYGILNSATTYINWFFRRAPSFFDVVCYIGTGTATTVAHNLGVVPELMIVKSRSAAGNQWAVYAAPSGNTNVIYLNKTDATSSNQYVWNNTTPTSTVFTVSIAGAVNTSAATYVAYLFATCAGVSKCTSFTGTGTLQTIDCGFTAGSRFVLIKRTDSTGDWYVWDSSRGLSSSTDPYLLLNSTAAEVTSTNWVDTTSTGFQVTAASGNNVNINGASYIALAIA